MNDKTEPSVLTGTKAPETVADFLSKLPTEAEVKRRIEQNKDEKKQLDRLLKIVGKED